MKKSILFLLLLVSKEAISQLTPIMYFPNNASFATPEEVYYKPGVTQSWYDNLQKYWYYRYRLVNDFLFISDNNEAGSSIPAIKRLQDNADEESPSMATWPDGHWDCASCNVLSWGDATVDLGHYIQMLAIEEELLRECSHPVNRSQYELKHALDAFDRLDDNAEQYSHEMNANLGSNNAYPGTLGPTSISYADRHNGFFIRDDVPALTLLDPDWPGNKLKHFNRDGIKRTWTYPGTEMYENRNYMYKVDASFTSSLAEIFVGHPDYPQNRWEGTIGSHTVPHNWSHSAPRYPTQESIDQLIDINLGMALVCKYSTDPTISNQAADALYRTVKYPFNAFVPQIHDPLTGNCVYGIVPEHYPGTCDKAGANYFGIAMGGAQSSAIYADPHGHSSTPMIHQASINVVSSALWALAQYGHVPMHNDGCDDPDVNEFRDNAFSAYYACLTNSWAIPAFLWGSINTTWKNLKKICNKDGWGRPQLPLIYELLYNPPENYRYTDYEVALNAAPPCGTYDFSRYEDPSGNRPFNDEILAVSQRKHWTGGDWLSNSQHRWLPECVDASDHTSRAVTFNGLDYMNLFDLFSLKQRASYLKNLNNPYWDDDYQINYPDNYSIGSNGIPLYLNFLEYTALKGKYSTTSNVSIRGAKQIECKEGFDSQPNCDGCFTDIYIRDFGCDETFTFAWVPTGSLALLPTTDEAISPWAASRMPPPDSSLLLADSLITDEMEEDHIDSLVSTIIATGNEDAISMLVSWGFDIDSFITESKNGLTKPILDSELNSAFFVQVIPNPANGLAYIKYKLVFQSFVDIKITNSLGTDFTHIVEPYDQTQVPENYSIGLNTTKAPPGVYIVTIKINNQVYYKKLTII